MEKFSTEMMGYSKKEVSAFVDDVLNELDSNIEYMRKMEKELAYLRNESIRYKQNEATLKNSITQSESLANDIRNNAKKEANIVLMEARTNANRIVNDALLRAEKVEIKKDTLERNMRIYKKKLRSIVEQQLEIVEEIEILEL